MTAPFRLYGAELSPYSVKVRSYLRYKGLEFEWRARTNATQEEFQRYAKLPLIPVLVDAEETALQDSTPIIEKLEAQFPESSITPDEPALAFLSALLEDYADEWLNKAMFHYRWSYPDDQESAARRITDMIFEGAEKPAGIEDAVRTRMIGRLYHVGSSPETAPLIEGSFTRLLGLLDRLLASPRFGERMAVHWLDVARYADSFGYQADLDTHAWPYRDWVIQALNENLPFDQFITYQLAGDLLPDATRFQQLATAFNRVHRKTQEGGSIEEEWRQEGVSDRVHTMGTALMGLTFECARCHDHKYDPIAQTAYYQMRAVFEPHNIRTDRVPGELDVMQDGLPRAFDAD